MCPRCGGEMREFAEGGESFCPSCMAETLVRLPGYILDHDRDWYAIALETLRDGIVFWEESGRRHGVVIPDENKPINQVFFIGPRELAVYHLYIEGTAHAD